MESSNGHTGGSAITGQDLLDALGQPGDSDAQIVAVLWSWLTKHLAEYGSLGEKAPAIRARAVKVPLDPTAIGPELPKLREHPVLGAASLLARIHEHYVSISAEPTFESARSIDGEPVIVMWRRPSLASRLGPDSEVPPSAMEHPSLSALAPRLSVSPVYTDEVRAEVIELETDIARRIEADLVRGLAGELEVHLDTLGDAESLRTHDEWQAGTDETVGVTWFGPGTESQEAAVEEALRGAVRHASGSAISILILPELTVSSATLAALQDELATQDENCELPMSPPVLTVVGCLHHEIAVESGPGESLLAGHVNEAVILGPDGSELWRHRKLTSAADSLQNAQGLEATVVEDIRLGDRIGVLPTPLGAVSVVICLDCIADRVRRRLIASPAEVLLIPSLSKKVIRHRSSLGDLVQKLWGVAFVCNRWLTADGASWLDEDVRSFYAAQRRGVIVPPPPAAQHPSFVIAVSKPELTDSLGG
jgi:predicted amidohydrolase